MSMSKKDSLLLVLFLALVVAPVLTLLIGVGAVVAMADAYGLERKAEGARLSYVEVLNESQVQLTLEDVIKGRLMSWGEYTYCCRPCGYEVRTIDRGGVTYRFVTNSKRGGYYHGRYIELASQGYPIVFDEKAYDVYGQVVEDSVAVFVASGSVAEVHKTFRELVDGDDLRWAKSYAQDGFPAFLWREFIKTGRVSEEEGRRLLARAFERAAERDERMVGTFVEDSSLGQLLLEEARLEWELARRLRGGESAEIVMAEYFAYYAD